MNHYEQLWLFFALVFGIIVLPGLDMAFVMGSTLAGALYIAWIGISLLRSEASLGLHTDVPLLSRAATFRQGVLTSLLNPKAYLFMLAVFPQFLRPEYGVIWLQATLMWLIIAINQFFIYGGVTVMADRARRWLQGRPAASMLATRCVGGLLIAAAMLTGFEGWQRI